MFSIDISVRSLILFLFAVLGLPNLIGCARGEMSAAQFDQSIQRADQGVKVIKEVGAKGKVVIHQSDGHIFGWMFNVTGIRSFIEISVDPEADAVAGQ